MSRYFGSWTAGLGAVGAATRLVGARAVSIVARFLDFWQHSCYPFGMASVDRKQELFENIARLRRVGRLVPENDDLAAVRLDLEQELGETVSRRLAARVLGVSHTALERWVKRGDVPLVFTPAGRQEVPVTSLLELDETVRAAIADAPARHSLAAAIKGQQNAAARLSVDWPRHRSQRL